MSPVRSVLSPLDWVVAGAYLTLVLLVAVAASAWSWVQRRVQGGVASSPRPTGARGENVLGLPEGVGAAAADGDGLVPERGDVGGVAAADAPEDFFLADRSASWWVVAASFFASNIGTDAIVGLSSAGASFGLAAASFDLASSLAFLALAYVALPAYRSSGVFTLPEWAEARFGTHARVYLAALSLALYALAKVSVALYCGSLVIAYVTGASPLTAISALLLLTAIVSTAGGLRSVLAVEVWNTGLLLVGGAAAAIVSVRGAGGAHALLSSIHSGTDAASRAAGMTPGMAHLAQPAGAPYALPALVVGAPWLILWFHAADQEMVQRGLCGRSDAHAKLGAVIAGWLKLTVPWTWALPGLAARILFPHDLGCPPLPESPSVGGGEERPTPCTLPNLAYPVLMTHLLPPGLAGAMLAACLAGVLSVLSSTLNSASTLATMDLARLLAARLLTPVEERGEGRKGGARAEEGGREGSETSPLDLLDDRVHDEEADEEGGEGGGACSRLPAALARALGAVVTACRRTCASCALPYRPTLGVALLRPNTLVWLGRGFIVLLVGVSVAWLPVLPRLAPSLYTAIQSLNSYVAPPVAVVFTAGLLWPGATANGALAALYCGHGLGVLRLLLELTRGGEDADDTSARPPPGPSKGREAVARAYDLLARPDFLYFAAASACVSSVMLVGVSLHEGAPPLGKVGLLSAPCALRAWRRVTQARALVAGATGHHVAAQRLLAMAEQYASVLHALEEREAACHGCGRRRRVDATQSTVAGGEAEGEEARWRPSHDVPECSPGFGQRRRRGTSRSDVLVRSPGGRLVAVLPDEVDTLEVEGRGASSADYAALSTSREGGSGGFPHAQPTPPQSLTTVPLTPRGAHATPTDVEDDTAALIEIPVAGWAQGGSAFPAAHDRLEPAPSGGHRSPPLSSRQTSAANGGPATAREESVARGGGAAPSCPHCCADDPHCAQIVATERRLSVAADVAAVGLVVALVAIVAAIW